MKKEHCVYVYLDTTKPGRYKYGEIFESEFEPIYVGAGKTGRCVQHLKVADNWRTHLGTSNLLRKKISNMRKNDKEPIVISLDNISQKEAWNWEKKLIKVIGRKDLRTGSLVNKSGGGPGSYGRIYEPTDETRKKHSRNFKKYWSDPKVKKKHSKKMKEIWKDSEYRKKTRKSLIEYWKNHPEKKKERSVFFKKITGDPNHKEKISKVTSERNIENWKNFEYRKKMTKVLKKAKEKQGPMSSESRKKLSESLKKFWKDPQNRKRMIESQRKRRKEHVKS